MSTKIKTPQHHIHHFQANFETKYDYSTCTHELKEGRSVYKMPFKELIDLKSNYHHYGSVSAWYKASEPESRKAIEKITIKPAPKKEKINKEDAGIERI